MKVIEIIAIIVFSGLLAFAVYTLLQTYLCDKQSCKAFDVAKTKASPGTKEYTEALLESLSQELMWVLPYIGSAILTLIALWFLGCEFTVVNFAILFTVSFVVTFLVFWIFISHHIKVIANYVLEYIKEDC